MNIHLGSLIIKSIIEHRELLVQKVADYLLNDFSSTEQIGIAEINPELSDTAIFCEHYQIESDQAANCVVLEAKRADKIWFAACVVLGNTKADVNGLARRTLDAKKVSFAPMQEAVAQTGMEYGAITPIGLPKDWPILIDKAVIDTEYIVIGSGIRKSKLVLPGKLLASLPNTQVLESLGQPKVTMTL